jgi:predicted permease
VRINGEPATIIGVMPEDFVINREEFYVSLRNPESPISVFALLRVRGTAAAARAELSAIGSRLGFSIPQGIVLDLREDPVGRAPAGAVGSMFALFLVATLLVVLIASSNVTHLLLVAGEMRRDQRAVQLALGASRARVFAESMCSSLLLGLAAGALGLFLALWATDILVAVIPNGMPGWIRFGLDHRVFLFATGAGVLAAVLVGAVPARQALTTDVSVLLKSSALSARSHYARGRRGVIVTEMALSVALVTGTLVIWRNAARLDDVDPGYDAGHVLSVRVGLADNPYSSSEQVSEFYRAAMERVSALPAVRAASLAGNFRRFTEDARPDSARSLQRLQGRDAASARPLHVSIEAVDDAFLETLNLPLLRGRFFGSEDAPGGVWTAVVSESLAKELWPDGDALGREIRVDSTIQRWAVVIGVVGDRVGIRSGPQSMQAEAGRTVYFSTRHATSINARILVRAAGDPLTLVPAIREAIRAIDAEQPVLSAETMLEEEVGPARLAMQIFGGSMGVIGMAGFALAVIGLYGVISHIALQRTREIGVRMALGATPATIARDVLVDATKLASSGLAAGLLLTLVLARLARGIVFGFVVAGVDPVAYGAAALVFGVVAIAAAWFPARRAMAVDPRTAMRSL